jgi:hypothetical protein
MIVFTNQTIPKNKSSNEKINFGEKKVFDIKLYFTRTDAEMKIR